MVSHRGYHLTLIVRRIPRGIRLLILLLIRLLVILGIVIERWVRIVIEGRIGILLVLLVLVGNIIRVILKRRWRRRCLVCQQRLTLKIRIRIL